MASTHIQEKPAPWITAEEALRQEPEDLFIEDGAEVTISPDHREYSRYFSRVKAKSIRDLQTLGLVPRGVRDEQLREAIVKDDAVAFQTARELVARSASIDCECTHSKATAAKPYRDQLASTYSSVRKAYNPALAELLSQHYKTEFRWDSINLQSVHGWVSRASRLAAEGVLIVSLFKDIRIGRGAKLVLDPTCNTLYARGLYIHQTGTLVHRGPYLRIWATSIERYVDWGSVVIQQEVPWKLVSTH